MPSTFTCLRYHIVFSTKDRQPFLTQPLLDPLHRYLAGCLRKIDGTPLEVGGIDDHVHIVSGVFASLGTPGYPPGPLSRWGSLHPAFRDLVFFFASSRLRV